MSIEPETLKRLIADELNAVADARITTRIRELLVEPTMVLRGWDYGPSGQLYPCWTVLEDISSDTGIAYCEQGFGPKTPWGLVWLGRRCDRPASIGQDCGWFKSFTEAFLDSFAAADLPI
jgi:hypothetical protein